MEMLSPILTATDVVNRKYVDDSIPTLASLMGSSAIGTTSAYPYWTGSAWATKSLGTFAFKSSLAFSELASRPTTIAGYGITDAITTANIGSQSVAYAASAGSASSCTGNAATATKLATARTIWGQSFDGSGNVSGALSGATTISASSVICGTESLRVNAADNAGNFGYMRVETVSSNRGLVHIGANYGGNTTITNTSVRVDAIGLYRGVVGIGRTYTYDELYANQSAGKSLQVDGSTQITGTLCVGASYSADGAAGVAAVVIQREGGIEISHASTPYIDFHYANSTSDYSVRLINMASNTLNLYGHFCGGKNETYSLGTSSLRWHTLYGLNANISATATIATADVTTLKIGSATLTYDSTAGALKIDGNVYATGQVAAGGAGTEGEASSGSGTTYDIATASTAGLVKPISVITKPTLNSVTTTSGRYYSVQMSSDGNMFVNVPWPAPASVNVSMALTEINGNTITLPNGVHTVRCTAAATLNFGGITPASTTASCVVFIIKTASVTLGVPVYGTSRVRYISGGAVATAAVSIGTFYGLMLVWNANASMWDAYRIG